VLRLRWMGSRWLRVYIIKHHQHRVLNKKANPPVRLRNIAPASMVFIIFESDSPTTLHTQSLHNHPPHAHMSYAVTVRSPTSHMHMSLYVPPMATDGAELAPP